MRCWPLALLLVEVITAWLLLLACKEIYARLRTPRQHARDDPNRARFRDSKRASKSRLETQIGWFWLVLSWHLCLAENGGTAITSKRSSQTRRKPFVGALKTFYTIGTICTLLAFITVPFYLAFMLYQAVVIDTSGSPQGASLDSTAPSGLLIPGLTVPLRDWVPLFLAGLVAIAWHEAGHAITAILTKVDITSIAFILVFAFPGAYVALDHTSLNAVSNAPARLRIIAAGVWHNLVLCLFIWSGMQMNILGRDSSIYRYLGFEDMNDQGVVVQLVDHTSALNELLKPSTLITHLDDVELHDSHQYRHWDNYLHSDEQDGKFTSGRTYDSLGFCVDEKLFEQQSTDCCMSENANNEGLARDVCYVPSQRDKTNQSNTTNKQGHCFDPGNLLGRTRCVEICNQANQICIHPSPLAHLLRMTIRDVHTGQEEVIMYRGSKRRIWESVKVGRYRATFEWMQSIPVDTEAFWLYTSGISLSLALFNLLPLPRLDGSELLDVLLSAPPGFAPVLPLVRESKLVGTVQTRVTREGRLDGLLESMLSGLQGALVGGASSARGMGPSRRVKLVKAGIQVSVAALAGIYMLGTLYSQVLV